MDDIPANPDAVIAAERALANAFSPHAPINQARFFHGRRELVREVVDTVNTAGLHAVIYGERGVGKTSLANMIGEYLGGDTSVSRVICSQGDAFETVIRRALSAIKLAMQVPKLGFAAGTSSREFSLWDALPDPAELAADEAASLVAGLPFHLVIILDEFDRLPKSETVAFADFIKALSDRTANTTVVLVGVAEDINSLLASHASVERCLRQIHLPRMSEVELGEIIDNGLAEAGFTMESPKPRGRILAVSQGFPHYTHLLAQYAGRSALDKNRRVIDEMDVVTGMVRAVDRADQSTRDLYHRAVTGSRKDHLWREVVTACALATSDERGYFSSRDIQDALAELLNRPANQQAFTYHLAKLISPDHGPLLERIGAARRFRYRFVNPLMRPFILMKAINDGLLPSD